MPHALPPTLTMAASAMAGAATMAPKAAVCLDPTALAIPATTFSCRLRLPARSPAPAGGLRLRAAPAKAGVEEIVLQEISSAVQLPGSKSLSNRILLLSALSEMEGTTVFMPSLEGMKHVKLASGVILTNLFLEVCKHILPMLDKFGSAMSIVKNDIGGSITRLETKYASDPSKYKQLHTMVQVIVSSKIAKSSSSCTNGLLWLTRFP